MDFNEVLNELEILTKTGKKMPGFRGKIMVESDKLMQLHEAIKSGMPADVEEAQAIILQKESIVNQANLEAKRIKDDAERHADELRDQASENHEEKVSDSEVLREANNRGGEITANAGIEAQSIVQDAQRKAYAMISDAESAAALQREGADRYSMEVLAGLEEKLADVLGQVRRGMDTLRVDQTVPSTRNGITV